MDLLRTEEKKLVKHMDIYKKKLVSSLILFPPLNSFPPFRSKEKLVSAETIQGNTVFENVNKQFQHFTTLSTLSTSCKFIPKTP